MLKYYKKNLYYSGIHYQIWAVMKEEVRLRKKKNSQI